MAFRFGGTPIGAAAPQPASGFSSSFGPAPAAPAKAITVPSFDALLPGRSIWYQVDHLIRTVSSSSERHVGILAAQEFLQLFQDKDSPLSQGLRLRSPPHSVLDRVAPDHALRQQLAQSLLVRLSIDGVQEARLTPTMLQDICAVTDDLHVSEVVAISLYQQALASDVPIQSNYVRTIFMDSNVPMDTTSTAWLAREIYFSQSSLILQAVLALCQHRLRESDGNASSCRPATEATDFLLESDDFIANLIQMIQKYSQMINDLLVERMSNGGRRATPGAPPEDASQVWRHEVLLQTCFRERLLAVECLFFITYQVQLKASEVVALIHLVRDLSNDCLILNPFTDVPDPWEFSSSDASPQFGAPWLSPQPLPQLEKGRLAWERELVTTAWKTGQPQLLQCVSILLVALLSALGDQTLFMDRITHVPNAIGVGNCLFPPGSTSIDKNDILHAALSRESVASWKRPDVLGLIMASYAMLLRSSPMALSSPRANATGVDIRKSFRDCIEASCEHKAFTFGRLCLIPALLVSAHIPNDYTPMSSVSTMCDITEFLLSVVTEFASQFLNILSTCGDQPISRAKWELDAEETLKLRRAHQEQQQSFRGQFPTWRDTSTTAGTNEIPSEVDLLARPDCVDDIVAFSTSVGLMGPNYALQFWSREPDVNQEAGSEDRMMLVPSHALTWLDRQQRDDDSLRPLFLSFLAALALAKDPSNTTNGMSGADVVHGIISNEDGSVGSGWSSLLEVLRWYTRQLSPDFVVTAKNPVSSSIAGGSTSYYYSNSDDSSYETDFRSERSRSGDTAMPSMSRELGEKNELIILSNLAVIANVASNSAQARCAIATMNLPVIEADGESVGQESALMVLFTLAVMPLSPEIRGSVFRAIAMLLSVSGCTTGEMAVEIRKAAGEAWELLESCHFVPICALANYPNLHDANVHPPKMLFPPSSSALASGRTGQFWIASDPRYGILYEMEFIESYQGRYPSTEGFLHLLTSLFATGGFPSGLGSKYRIRTGCAPYVEYIIDYLLPRATGRFEHYEPLSFRTSQDKNRLIAIALEAVETVLAQYHIPGADNTLEPGDSLVDSLFHATKGAALKALQRPTIANSVVARPQVEDTRSLIDDFAISSTLPLNVAAESSSATQALPNNSKSAIPRSKSPGFAVLASMFSSSRRSLLDAVMSTLVCHKNRDAVCADFLLFSLAFALYVSTPPTFSTAKDGVKGLWTKSGRQSLLVSLRPTSYVNEETPPSERSILSALRLLCASVAREDHFLQRMVYSKANQIPLIPFLRFSGKSRLPISIDVHLANLSYIVATSDAENGIVAAVVDLIGFISPNGRDESVISSMAMAIVFYIERSLPRQKMFELLCHANPRRVYGSISEAFKIRVFAALARPPKEPNVSLLRSIFDRLLLDLRSDAADNSIVHEMFGVSTEVASSQKSIDAILSIMESSDFVFSEDSAEVAAMCYETLYRLVAGACKNGDQDKEIALLVAACLRTRDFWKTHVLRLCSIYMLKQTHSTNRYYIIHSIAWLLKGVACELHILSGLTSTGRVVTASPNSFKRLCGSIFSDNGLLAQAIRVIPIERPVLEAGSVATPSDEHCVIGAKIALVGSLDVVQGYSIVDLEILRVHMNRKGISFDEDGLLAWVEHWNHSVHMECSSAHLSDAIRLAISTFLACRKDSVFDVPPELGPGVTTMLQIFSCIDAHGFAKSNIESIDDILFTTACRNLSLAAFQVSISDSSKALCQNDLEMSSLIGILMRLIAATRIQSRNGLDYSRRRERIAALAGALVHVLKEYPDQICIDTDRISLFEAAVVLAKLSIHTETPEERPFSPSTEVLLFRNCFGLLLEKMEAILADDGFSICRAVLIHSADENISQTPLQGIFHSIATLDDNIALLVQRLIFVSPQISSLMVTSGILESLKKAADNYFREEEKFITYYTSSQKYGDLNIQAPTFLRGHFDIMSALMTSDLSPNLSCHVISTIISISCIYKPLMERLIRQFPDGGDTMYTVLRCMIQASAKLDEAKHTTIDASDLSLILVNNSENLNELFVSISKLIFHIAEYPLPPQMLIAMPSRLNPPVTASGIIAMTEPVAKSWWVAQEAKSSEVAGFCEIAMLGMKLLRFGVCFIRQSSVLSTLDEFTLSRSLFRCSDAVLRIDSASRSLQEQLNMPQSTHFELEQLRALRSMLVGAVEDILILTILRVRELKKNHLARLDKSIFASRCQAIAFALDHIDLDVLNRSPSSAVQDENHGQLTSALSRELRDDLNQIS